MSLRKIQRGRLELAFYILVPIALFSAIVTVESVYSRRAEREINERKTCLRLLPMLERRTQEVCTRLIPFSGLTNNVDGSSELTMRVNKTAQDRGIATKSVKLEKLPLPDNSAWSDFKVMLNGEGSSKALVQFLDESERSVDRQFRVEQFRAMAKTLTPEPVYDADVVFVSRTVNCMSQDDGAGGFPMAKPVDAERVFALAQKADQLQLAMEKRRSKQWGPLSVRKLELKASVAPVNEEEIPFKLTGVIRDGKTPLAMTDQGLLGVGDSSGGYRIVEIRDDSVVVENRQRVKTVLKLYSGGGEP